MRTYACGGTNWPKSVLSEVESVIMKTSNILTKYAVDCPIEQKIASNGWKLFGNFVDIENPEVKQMGVATLISLCVLMHLH